jgi:hypothetical protein
LVSLWFILKRLIAQSLEKLQQLTPLTFVATNQQYPSVGVEKWIQFNEIVSYSRKAPIPSLLVPFVSLLFRKILWTVGWP